MILYPNCKINLGLRVIRKREDGYHNLETVFVPVYGLHDELEIEAAAHFSFHQEGITVDCAEADNLIVRCYRLMAARYPQIGPVAIRLRKKIPFGAGLGGGSSDAAHTAIALNEIFSLRLSKEQLAAEVQSLGADCPFFFYNTPCYADGIGDRLRPVALNMRGLRLLLVKPHEGVSTREAYSGIITHPEAEGRLKALFSRHHDAYSFRQEDGPVFVNDFEQTVFPLHPGIAAIKKRLQDAGALFASMSGSGSTVFGLFEDNTESGSDTGLRVLEEEFASMVLFNNTFGEWQS